MLRAPRRAVPARSRPPPGTDARSPSSGSARSPGGARVRPSRSRTARRTPGTARRPRAPPPGRDRARARVAAASLAFRRPSTMGMEPARGQEEVGVCQARIRQGVPAVLRDGLLVEPDGRLEAGRCPAAARTRGPACSSDTRPRWTCTAWTAPHRRGATDAAANCPRCRGRSLPGQRRCPSPAGCSACPRSSVPSTALCNSACTTSIPPC